MSIFSKILEKLGIGKDKPASTTAAPVAKPASVATAGATPKPAMDKGERENLASKTQPPKTTVAAKPAPAMSAAPTGPTVLPHAPMAVSEVDVVKKLEGLSAGSGLDWKVSIVDLLKLLGIDSSREARNELAKELGCPAELMSDSAKMNVWLHKTVLKKIAENGGNIPQSLLD